MTQRKKRRGLAPPSRTFLLDPVNHWDLFQRGQEFLLDPSVDFPQELWEETLAPAHAGAHNYRGPAIGRAAGPDEFRLGTAPPGSVPLAKNLKSKKQIKTGLADCWIFQPSAKDFAGIPVRASMRCIEDHLQQSSEALPLRKNDWPSRNGRPAWPSFLTPNECRMAIKKGVSPFPMSRTSGWTHRVPYRQAMKDKVFQRDIVGWNVIGIRSDVKVPRCYLRYFRYRWGFLILTATTIPIRLARFLLDVWKRDLRSLWLQRAVPFKKFLREVPIKFHLTRSLSFSDGFYSSEEEDGVYSHQDVEPEDFWFLPPGFDPGGHPPMGFPEYYPGFSRY
jgi:hypothetical protein